MRACELDDALGGDLLFEVLKGGGLHQVVTEVVPVGGGADQKKKKEREKKGKSSCAVRYLSEGLRRVWSLVLLVCL